jgi:hypothetical protein
VFETDRITAVRLNSLLISEDRKSNTHDVNLLAKGFVTWPVNDDEMLIRMTDTNGKSVPESQISFCEYKPVASYEKDNDSKPHIVELSGDDWAFNPYEVFTHADQFEFTSGVFTTSSRVFLAAKRGRVLIQFLCEPTGLKFYRALYYPPESVH